MKSIRFFIILFNIYLFSCNNDQIRIACIGDSITEGYGLANQSITAYPSVLDSILGPKYDVLNSGRSATTLQKEGNFPFWISKEFSNVFEFKPDIITIKLGTNDTKPENWNPGRFEKDYQSLIDTLLTIDSKPVIYLCLPVPVYKTNWGINDSTVSAGVIPIIKKLADKNKLKVIDLYSTMKNQSENFPDGIHPNEKAEKLLAEIIAKEIVQQKN
jgi:acyl-CoA thioesterase I